MKVIKPSKLLIGDTIGIIAPSLPVLPKFRKNYERGKKILTDMGFKIKEGKTIGLQRWWAAGTPKEQAEDINNMFADKNIKAIMAHTGGHSAITVLEQIDYRLVKDNPKPFIGMSDITVFHLAFLAKCNLVGFHMDDVTFGLGWNWKKEEKHLEKFDRDVFINLLTQKNPLGEIKPLTKWEGWRSGKAEGQLIGGNLHLINWQLATPYFPSLVYFDGAILFWEDVGEHLYDIARSLYQLKYAGILKRISGMLVGKLSHLEKSEDKGIVEPSAKEMTLEIVKDYDFPILANMDFGHYTVNIPMPLGVRARFDGTNKNFSIIESAVS